MAVNPYVNTPAFSETIATKRYIPRGRNELHTIFERHFAEFCEQYDEKYAATYGMYRIERIQTIGERFSRCGDYLQGIARIRCTNPECGLVGASGTCSAMRPGHDYSRPFSCKGFYPCPRMHGRATNEVSDQPSCSRKRTLLFAEHLTNEVLLRLPHRQFVFTMPKALRPFFRHDRRLFAEVSRLIYDILQEFYHEAAGRSLLTGIVVAHLRFFAKQNTMRTPYIRHYRHSATCSAGTRISMPDAQAEQQSVRIATRPIVLEGGFDDEGTFVYIPFSGLQSMVEVFRRRVIKLLVERGMLNEQFARNLLSWRHSGFSQDAWASSNAQHCDQPSTIAFAFSTSPRGEAWQSTSHGRPGCLREQ